MTGPSDGRDRLNWHDYQQPLRWDWSAFALVMGVVVVGALFAAFILRKL